MNKYVRYLWFLGIVCLLSTLQQRFRLGGSPATTAVIESCNKCPNLPRYFPSLSMRFKAQSGQDKFVLKNFFTSRTKEKHFCCQGTFVEFGARDGIVHSNTYVFEKHLNWTGLLFEVDPSQYGKLRENRPHSQIVHGPVCPSYQKNVTILMSGVGGYTGAIDSYEPTRKSRGSPKAVDLKCLHLADELIKRNMSHVDYMTIDTEGSELDIVKDFPWKDFDIRVVQIEQLVESWYPAQKGRKDAMIKHMTSMGYKLHTVYHLPPTFNTDDLIFVKKFKSEQL